VKEKEPLTWTPLEKAIPRELLRSEVMAWARRLGVAPQDIFIRPMKRKWGSCSTAGRISLSDDLLSQPANFRKRIIVHELVHLKVPNHGKLFNRAIQLTTVPTTCCGDGFARGLPPTISLYGNGSIWTARWVRR
jgi:predicted metal-dependent hydrolase